MIDSAWTSGAIQFIYLRDNIAQTTKLVSVQQDGGALANSNCYNPFVTNYGQYVLYSSASTNLAGPGIASSYQNIYAYDTAANQSILLTYNYDGSPTNGDSTNPTGSDSLNKVVFQSSAYWITTDHPDYNVHTFVSTPLCGIDCANGLVCSGSLTCESEPSNSSFLTCEVVNGDNGTTPLFMSGKNYYTRISALDSNGNPVTNSARATISWDATMMAYQTMENGVISGQDFNDNWDVYYQDFANNLIARASGPYNISSGDANGVSVNPMLSKAEKDKPNMQMNF